MLRSPRHFKRRTQKEQNHAPAIVPTQRPRGLSVEGAPRLGAQRDAKMLRSTLVLGLVGIVIGVGLVMQPQQSYWVYLGRI